MSKHSTILMWSAVVMLMLVYVFPLWRIGLQAPQYPDGLGIDIWINKITGRSPHDLQNINGLNHYIGMAAIEPDSIPELTFMKWILAGLAALGAVVAILRRRWLLLVWAILAIVLSGVGMYDFWKWEYTYGHELDPSAAIKVPGMSYQPPMFGTKQMLNFRATAWPGLGGLAAMLGVALGSVAMLLEIVPRRRASAIAPALLAAPMLLFPACSTAPQPIEYGVDACEYCRMTIADDRYGAAIATKKGRTLKYDSIECMIDAAHENAGIAEDDIAGWYVTDFVSRKGLIEASSATYLHCPALPSPMGGNLTAFALEVHARETMSERGGTVMEWTEVQELRLKSGDRI